MVERDSPPPRHIDPDSIIEALLEIRFDAPTVLPEVLFGRLAEHSMWSGFQQRKLPAYEVPAPLREADANFRFAPIFELGAADLSRSVRIGPHVFSYHMTTSYPGWPSYRGELSEAVDTLFQKATGLTVNRLGMRYLNALRTDLHRINSAADLDLEISVARESQLENMNLNYLTEAFASTRCLTRIATPDFVQGPKHPEARVFVDVDVFTGDGFAEKDSSTVMTWVDNAHNHLKQEFFHVLKKDTIEQLKRD